MRSSVTRIGNTNNVGFVLMLEAIEGTATDSPPPPTKQLLAAGYRLLQGKFLSFIV